MKRCGVGFMPKEDHRRIRTGNEKNMEDYTIRVNLLTPHRLQHECVNSILIFLICDLSRLFNFQLLKRPIDVRLGGR